MQIIRNSVKIRAISLGEQKFNKKNRYRRLTYLTLLDVEDGELIYNNLTDELLFLTLEEKKIFGNPDLENSLIKELVRKWYLVPADFDDSTLCNQLDSLLSLLRRQLPSSDIITTYTIFPTTDCNARCFYCYEKNVKKYNMTEETAKDVAAFIIEKSGGKSIRLHWFGGEPLYNSVAIDTITQTLSRNNIDYISSMISNGFLFDEQVIKKAKDLWHLRKVQITIDGTEEKYNLIKNYIYPNVNAFKRIISNIEKLLISDIVVTIRLNMDNHNYEDLFHLVDFLFDKFGNYKKFEIYSQMLFDESTEKHLNRTLQERMEVFNKNQALNLYIKERGRKIGKTLNGYLKNNQCMADRDDATTILPDGHLGKCEHFSDKYFWGSIYTEEVNRGNIFKFKEREKRDGKCNSCPAKPGCRQLVSCPDAMQCNPILQQSHLDNIKNRIMNTYIEWKKEKE